MENPLIFTNDMSELVVLPPDKESGTCTWVVSVADWAGQLRPSEVGIAEDKHHAFIKGQAFLHSLQEDIAGLRRKVAFGQGNFVLGPPSARPVRPFSFDVRKTTFNGNVVYAWNILAKRKDAVAVVIGSGIEETEESALAAVSAECQRLATDLIKMYCSVEEQVASKKENESGTIN